MRGSTQLHTTTIQYSNKSTHNPQHGTDIFMYIYLYSPSPSCVHEPGKRSKRCHIYRRGGWQQFRQQLRLLHQQHDLKHSVPHLRRKLRGGVQLTPRRVHPSGEPGEVHERQRGGLGARLTTMATFVSLEEWWSETGSSTLAWVLRCAEYELVSDTCTCISVCLCDLNPLIHEGNVAV